MMTKSTFLKFHGQIVRTKEKTELGKVILELLHQEHSEPRDALLALAMANKRILYNVDYFDSKSQLTSHADKAQKAQTAKTDSKARNSKSK